MTIDWFQTGGYIDCHNRKGGHVEKLMGHVDWDEANARFRMASS